MHEPNKEKLPNREQYWLSQPIGKLELSERSRHGLDRAGIKYVHELIQLSESDIRTTPNLSNRSVVDVKNALNSVGLKLGMNVNQEDELSADAHTPSSSALVCRSKELKSNHDEVKHWLRQTTAKLELRVRSQNGLERAGIMYVYELVQLTESDIVALQGMGGGSIVDIRKALKSVGLKLGMKIDLEYNLSDDYYLPSTPTSTFPPEEFKSISIAQLGFSPKTRNCLNFVDTLTAFDLVSKSRSELVRIPKMGRKSLREIDSAISALQSACDHTGNFSRTKLSENSNFAGIIPFNYNDKEHNAFIMAVPTFFQEFCSVIDEREKYIAETRIWPIDGKISTLEEIGEKFNLTRERVRQIEKKVVNQLAGLLCEGTLIRSKMTKKNYLCDINFSASWLKAADSFSGIKEMDIHSFSERLCKVWQVDMEEIFSVLPLAIVVFTRSTTTELSRKFRSDSHISAPMTFASDKTSSTKLSSFRIGRNSRVLIEAGIVTIGDLRQNWPLKETASTKHIIVKLILAEKYLDPNGDLDWKKYTQSLGLKEIAGATPTNPSQFFASLNDFLSESIPHLMTWSNCKEVFDLRTRFPAHQRKILKDCAIEIFGKPKNGPVIARIEKYLLENIANALVNHDFTYTKIWIPQEFLDYFDECRNQYDKSNGDYQVFCTQLCQHFSLSQPEVLNCSSVLWGVFNGLPPERYFHLTGRKLAVKPSIPDIGQKIKLVGFRSVH